MIVDTCLRLTAMHYNYMLSVWFNSICLWKLRYGNIAPYTTYTNHFISMSFLCPCIVCSNKPCLRPAGQWGNHFKRFKGSHFLPSRHITHHGLSPSQYEICSCSKLKQTIHHSPSVSSPTDRTQRPGMIEGKTGEALCSQSNLSSGGVTSGVRHFN